MNQNNESLRNWAELPPDLTFKILSRFSPIDRLEKYQKVCKSWYHVCKDPLMWRKLGVWKVIMEDSDREIMCRRAVDRSQGWLVEIGFWRGCTNELLNYIADRSSNLKHLELKFCYPWSYPRLTDNGLVNALMKFPFLEYLEMSHNYGKFDLKALGNSCPLLKTFKLNRKFCNDNVNIEKTGDDEALAIAETMSELRHLELCGNTLTNSGVEAILENCLHLEHLDLTRCNNIKLIGDLEKQCSERIRYLTY